MGKKIFALILFLYFLVYPAIYVCSSPSDAELILDKDKYFGLGDAINVKINAPSLNIYKKAADRITIKVYTSEDPEGFSVNIQETRINSGVFSGILRFSLKESNPNLKTIKVKNGIKIYVRFNDLIKEAVWQPNDGSVNLDRKSYNGYGAQAVVTVTDNDLNLKPGLKEEITVTVCSSTDTKGINLKLCEKTADSGVFAGTLSFANARSEDAEKKLKVSYNDTVTVSYKDSLCTSGKSAVRTACAIWKPCTGTVMLSKNNFTGLYSEVTATIKDQDLNLRPGSIDKAGIRITSGADPKGFVLQAYETGANTGVFTGSFGFSEKNTDADRNIIKINPVDSIIAVYIDERNANNEVNKVNTKTASFQFAEAVIQTSAVNDEGIGNMLDITITEPDANMPGVRNRLTARVGSGSSADDLTLHLEETGKNTGVFKGRLYFTENETREQTLHLEKKDKINIKYTDRTTPAGEIKEIRKTVSWAFQSTILKLDKDAYTGYNSPIKITLNNWDLNKNRKMTEFADVTISTSHGSTVLKLEETKADSGVFSGTFHFGRSFIPSKGIIKVSGNDTVTVSYFSKEDGSEASWCYASWLPQDGQITLNKEEYRGNAAAVKITVKDCDIGNLDNKSTIRVTAGAEGSTNRTNITLTETTKSSGIFTGIIYINGGGRYRPSVKLRPGDRLEVIYTDNDTAGGNAEERKAYAAWTD